MPYIQLDETQFPLSVGETRLGGPGADITLPGAASSAAEAVVQCTAPDQVFISRGREDAAVRVNGVTLGVEPTPLFHGDKIEIGTLELLYGDDRRSGNTQFLTGAGVRDRLVPGAATGNRRSPARPTASTGGRLVSLMDGREYAVPPTGATIGRDAACDIVVASNDVSRQHAEVRPVDGGYLLRDRSTNGVCVNEERIDGEQLLGRGDVVRVGTEEFRFYADEPEPATAAAAAGRGEGRAAIPPQGVLSVANVPSLANTMAQPAVVRGAAERGRPVLATLEITNQGVLRGQRFEVRTPLAHVGRGAHNDIAVADDSVSETHAKLQKREAGWFVVDMNSTNGTYVAGQRIRGEQRLDGVSDLRFGGVKMSFRPAGAAASAGVGAADADDATGTREITGRGPAAPRPAAAARRSATPGGEERSAGGGVPGWIWVLSVAAAGATAFLLLRQAR